MRAPPTLGPLLRDARRQLRAGQEGFAKSIGVSARTISGWERQAVMPTPSQRARVASAFASIDHERWCAIVEALGLPLDAMLAKVPRQRALAEAHAREAIARPAEAPPADAKRARRGVLDDAIRVHAEMLDVTARRLRMAVAAILTDIERLGVTPGVARDIVLGSSSK